SRSAPRPFRIKIAVAPTRKPDRNEWMVEKLVELGVDEIAFMKTAHTHTESFSRVVNRERMEKIAIAAMKQSVQFFLPQIRIGDTLSELLERSAGVSGFIAYVPDKSSALHLAAAAKHAEDALVLIGPEGDFTQQEVHNAQKAGFS